MNVRKYFVCMVKMSSDNVELLSYTSNIGAGTTIYTPKVILTQYISLSIIGSASENLTIVLQFSGDGINYDYSVTEQLLAGDNVLISNPVVGKWLRLSISNTGLAPTTHLRIYVYASPSNSSVTAQIGKIGNYDPEISIYDSLPKTAFNELQTAEITPECQYIFNRGNDGDIITPTPTFSLPYQSIKMYDSLNDPLYPSSVKFYKGNMIFGRLAPFTTDSFQSCQGDLIAYRAGQGIIARFTACFYQGAKSISGTGCRVQFAGIGNLDDIKSLNDGMGFGFTTQYNWNTEGYNSFGIHYYQNGVRTFIPKSQFNVDRCDGTFKLPSLDFSKYQLFQVKFAYLGWGALEYSIYSPTTGRFLPVHIINNTNQFTRNNQTNFTDPCMGFCLFQKVESGCIPISNEENIAVSSFMLAIEGKDQLNVPSCCYNINKSILANVETPLIAIRCLGTDWYQLLNHYPLDISDLSLSSDGTKNVTFRLYYGGTITGGAWTTPYISIQPTEVNTTFTYNNASAYPINIYQLGKADNIHIDLNQHLHLNPNEYCVITAISTANSDVYCSISVAVH